MIPELRSIYNTNFSTEAYQKLLDWIAGQYQHRPPFPIGETPVFIPKSFESELLKACDSIVDLLVDPAFNVFSAGAIPEELQVPGEIGKPTFLQLDFGICMQENGKLKPQLIEIQGFPSLYFFQELLARAYRLHFDIPATFHALFSGYSHESYLEKLKTLILGDLPVENVVLLEVEPLKQATAIDFIAAHGQIGIPLVCISEVIKEGKKLFYKNGKGEKIPILRIFNRIIFDELVKRHDLSRQFNLTEEVDVQWAGHPNWFFKISKHTLPYLDSPYVPKSWFLTDWKNIEKEDLANYVLKPLYSFAGLGVKLNVQPSDLADIPDKHNYILQRKVQYAPVIVTPDEPAKFEIRMMFIWDDEAKRPTLINNLIRLSKGEMVGVRYNKGRSWVGGSVGFFER